MSREIGAESLFQRELQKVETLAGLRHALDFRYRRLCQAARADWERLFSDNDPADACVSVRVEAVSSNAIRGSGFLKSRRQSEKSGGKASMPRFAH
jgi:hypothetical protein